MIYYMMCDTVYGTMPAMYACSHNTTHIYMSDHHLCIAYTVMPKSNLHIYIHVCIHADCVHAYMYYA